jgi:hypothetical protein
MLKTIIITGWKPGFPKVRFASFLKDQAGLGLYSAKALTDALLNGQTIQIEVDCSELERIIMLMDSMRVFYKIEDTNKS